MSGLIVFDLDGTLVDASPDLTTAVNLMLGELGHPRRSLAEVQSYIGDGARELVWRALPPKARGDIERALERFRAHYHLHVFEGTYAYPGVAEMLDTLDGTPLVIATNKPLAHTEAILRALDWERRFRMVLGGDSLPVRKPDPGMLTHLLDALGARADESVMVGDGPQDVGAAHAAGMPCVGVTWGFFSAEALREAGADWIVGHPLDLAARLRARFAPSA